MIVPLLIVVLCNQYRVMQPDIRLHFVIISHTATITFYCTFVTNDY